MAVSTSQLLSRMSNLSEEEVDRHAKVLLYGPSGAGKTTTALWLAQNLISEDGQIAYLDSGEGWVSLEETPSLLENVHRLPYTEYGEMPALADAIRRKQKGFEHFEVVVIDEMDPIADDVLVTVVREKHGTPASAQLPEIDGKDYRPVLDLMRVALNGFKKAGVHVIIVAHDKRKKDHRNVETIFPALSPQLKNFIMGEMHVVGWATAEIKGTAAAPEYVRTIQSLPTKIVEAKTRIGALKKRIAFEPEDFIEAVVTWIGGPTFIEDMAAPEVDEDLQPDELPTDGIPVADNPDEDDDEPAYAGSDD